MRTIRKNVAERGSKLRTKLRDVRLKKGMTQEEVAKKAQIKRAYYCQLERGYRGGSIEKWLDIADALEIPRGEIIEYIKQ